MKYKKYFRKTSLKQKNIGDLFLEEIQKSNPKSFLEIGVFHGVTARNVCELLFEIHNHDFKYIGLDLFKKNQELDLSKPISSITRRLDKINKLKKKEIKIKKETLILSSEIFLSELKIVLFIMLFGLISFIISKEVIFNKI